MNILKLIPENWEFVEGRQNTCRLGDKWAKVVTPGKDIKFECEGDDTKELYATVSSIVLTTFDRLTDEQCGENHAYGGREALAAAMQRAYGDAFTEESVVTLIVFTVEGLGFVA